MVFENLHHVMAGLGWDEANRGIKKLFSKSQEIDCDIFAFACQFDLLKSSEDIIHAGNLIHKTGFIKHSGDNMTGHGEGDDEKIFIDLDSLPAMYNKIIIAANIHGANEKKQNFGMIKNAFVRVYDSDNNNEICKLNLTRDYSEFTSIIFCELLKVGGVWKFNLIAHGTNDGTMKDIAQRLS